MTCSRTHIVPRCPSCASPDHGSAACPTAEIPTKGHNEKLHALLDEAAGKLKQCSDSMNDPMSFYYCYYCIRAAAMIKGAFEMLKEAMEIDG